MSFNDHLDDKYAPIEGYVSQYHAFVCEYCVKVCKSWLKFHVSWCFIKPCYYSRLCDRDLHCLRTNRETGGMYVLRLMHIHPAIPGIMPISSQIYTQTCCLVFGIERFQLRPHCITFFNVRCYSNNYCLLWIMV